MIDDLAGYGPEASFDADLCIVGAGAAGIAIAREFLGTRMQVILLESGGLSAEADTDLLKRGESHGIDPLGLVEGRARGFGGTTALWAGQCIPLSEIDFRERDWVPHSGWPFGASELAPCYERAAQLLGVEGERYDDSLWRRWRLSPPALDPAKLGHSYTAWSPRPALGKVTRRDFERSANVRVLLHANVTGIETNEAGTSFDHLAVRSLGGASARVCGRACVLCCGGIENARLLLGSGNPERGGLGNAHDNVGRFFQDHPNVKSAVLRARRPRDLQEPYSLFYRRRRRYLPKLTLAPAVQRTERVLNCGANLQYRFQDEGLNAIRRVYLSARGRRPPEQASLRGDLRLAAGALPALASTAHRRLVHGRASAAHPATIWLQTHSEQAPDPESRVTLARARDALGSPIARVEWRLSDLERRTAEVMTRTVVAELGRLGLADGELADSLLDRAAWRRDAGDSYHHIGTTRMAVRAEDGVVDANCQVHGVAGLFLSGSSVFPTSGFANPTMTIVALALRLADHLGAAVE